MLRFMHLGGKLMSVLLGIYFWRNVRVCGISFGAFPVTQYVCKINNRYEDNIVSGALFFTNVVQCANKRTHYVHVSFLRSTSRVGRYWILCL